MRDAERADVSTYRVRRHCRAAFAGRAFELQDGAWPPAQFKARLRPLHAACADAYSMGLAKAITDWHIRG